MRFHKSSTTTDLLERGASKLAMMVASEFWRAHQGAEFREDVIRCYWRARELMGVLEIANLPESVGQTLAPYYVECSIKTMFSEKQLTPSAIEKFSSRLGERFDRTAQDLAQV